MPDYQQAFQDHPLHGVLAELESLGDRFGEIESDEGAGMAARIGAAVRHLLTLLAVCDPTLVPVPILNQLQKTSANMLVELRAFFDDKNDAHITNAANQVDGLVQQMATIRTVTPFESLAEAGTDLTTHRVATRGFTEELIRTQGELTTRAREELKALTSLVEALRTQVDGQRGEIDSQKSRLDKVIEGFQSQFSSDQQVRNAQHSAAEQERHSEFSGASKARDEQWQALGTKARETHDALVAELNANAIGALNYLEKKKQDAAALLKVTTNITVTGNYNRMANSDRWWGLSWRILAVGLMLVAVGMVWTAVDLALRTHTEAQIASVLLRVGVAAVVGLPAVYAAREAEKHRRSERQYRRMELELASIDPYIESLPEEQRNELKQRLAERLFAQTEVNGADKDETLGFLEELVKTGWDALLKRIQ